MHAHPFSDRLNDHRHAWAALGTMLFGFALLSFSRPAIHDSTRTPEKTAMLITMAPIEPPPPEVSTPPTVAPPPIPPAPAAAITAPTPSPASLRPMNSPIPVAPTAAPSEATVHKDSSPAEPNATSVALKMPPVSPASTPAAETPKPATAQPQLSATANPESSFTAQIRAQINASKRYPTGREVSLQRPVGKVLVWFVLNRSGHLQDSGIEDSSNSIILDNAALSTVRRANFTAWPEGAWLGQMSHKFTVTLDFAPPS